MPKKNSQSEISILRHSCSHVLAASVLQLFPKAKLGIGPAIENGFYYDFELPETFSEKDLTKISQQMAKIIKAKLPFEKKTVSIKKAQEIFKDQPYKLALIDELAKQGSKKVSFYQTGDFVDLCRGPHLSDTEKIGPFKLLTLAGAYWRGDEKNKMLTRIYGTCFPTQKELDKYLRQLEEAKKRDHRKLGSELDLFHFSPMAPGMPFWHPKGTVIWNELLKFWREIQLKYGYQEVKAPELLSVKIFKQSGHWDHYQDLMFATEWEKGKKYALKPMDCPGEIEIFKQGIKSYRDLPLRFAEVGLVHRKEKKGELNGLLRVAHITQDDAHIFTTEDQIQKEITQVIKLAQEIYRPFNLEYDIFLSTRPDNFMGNIKAWNKAEADLKSALRANKIDFEIKEGEGAFYGPKIDFDLKDAIDRTWQCATIQLDFLMPERFDLKYVAKGGKEKRPVIIHRTIMGALERFIGILIEHFAGAFPVWLAPVQAIIIPITDRHVKYGRKILAKLKEKSVRAELDDRNDTTSAKIRDAEMQKIPYILVIGDKEEKATNLNIRTRGKKLLGSMTGEKFLKLISEDIAKKRQI